MSTEFSRFNLMPGAAPGAWARALSILTHELQTSAGAIQIYVNLARRAIGPRDIEGLDASLEGIELSVLELNRVIQTLARAREIDAGELEVSKELAEVGDLVRRFVEELSGRLAPGRVAVTVPEGVAAHIDAGAIYDVLEELLANASRFAPEGTLIEVFVEQVDHHVEISVLDRGPGILEGQREEAFQRFSTLGSGRGRMGLGLFIARGIARAHGGDLTADHTRGGGFRLTMSIPLE